MQLSERSVERTVQANRGFDPGIRRVAAERQEVHRGVKSGLFVLSPCDVTPLALLSFLDRLL